MEHASSRGPGWSKEGGVLRKVGTQIGTLLGTIRLIQVNTLSEHVPL